MLSRSNINIRMFLSVVAMLGVATAQSKLFFGAYVSYDAAQYANALGHAPAMSMEFFGITAAGFSGAPDDFVTRVSKTGGLPILTLEPSVDIHQLSQTTFNNIAKVCAALNRQGHKIFVRFAHEMNAKWYPFWGGMADVYKNRFQSLSTALKNNGATTTYTIWAPNGAYNRDPVMQYEQYWPGGDFVDVVGLDLYNKNLDDGNAHKMSLIDAIEGPYKGAVNFYERYSVQENKPFIIAETSASTKVGMDTAAEYEWKMAWIKQVYSADTQSHFPNLRAVVWFETTKPLPGTTMEMHNNVMDRPMAGTVRSYFDTLNFLVYAPQAASLDFFAGFGGSAPGPAPSPPTPSPPAPAPNTPPQTPPAPVPPPGDDGGNGSGNNGDGGNGGNGGDGGDGGNSTGGNDGSLTGLLTNAARVTPDSKNQQDASAVKSAPEQPPPLFPGSGDVAAQVVSVLTGGQPATQAAQPPAQGTTDGGQNQNDLVASGDGAQQLQEPSIAPGSSLDGGSSGGGSIAGGSGSLPLGENQPQSASSASHSMLSAAVAALAGVVPLVYC